ncbi:spirocyclase AveC family protein [Saccharopolyspora phatthalungensis]|uniref:Uncharacterized protein n=1 Tax=Saccharopolyspora phatthalungensis TaxID=664693 RepID=A0A840QIH6_9PSEU|nr:spirocyclase AveC family protein [Saccharopolyspora phatthalungensis]MBB5159930.1 hypothetical protein [Saccharopolyspora phatthalungensis]
MDSPAPRIGLTKVLVGWSPIRAWATLGAVFVLIQAWIYGSWLVTGQAHIVTPVGPDRPPAWNIVVLRGFELLVVVILIVFAIRIVRQYRREHQLGADAVFACALLLTAWQDPLVNFVGPTLSLNSHMVSVSSWAAATPGWIDSCRGHGPESIFQVTLGYLVFVYIIVGLGRLFRLLERRWHGLSRRTLNVIALAITSVVIVALVNVSVWLELAAYPAAIPNLSFWTGTRYQFPIYHEIFYALWVGALAVLYFRRSADGLTTVERGLDALRPRFRAVPRILAVAGCTNLLLLPWVVVSAASSAFQSPTPGIPSYLLGNCASVIMP